MLQNVSNILYIHNYIKTSQTNDIKCLTFRFCLEIVKGRFRLTWDDKYNCGGLEDKKRVDINLF